MSELTIRTNNVPRDLLCWSELTKSEQADFDYIDSPDDSGFRFFRYRGAAYDVNEFMSVSDMPFGSRWDGYSADSYFSGLLVRLVDDCERVIVGFYYC